MSVKKVMIVSLWLRHLTTALMIAAPIVWLAAYLGSTALQRLALDAGPDWAFYTHMALSAAMLAGYGWVAWQLRRLFGAFARGSIFSTDSGDALLRAGAGVAALAVIDIAVRAAQSVLVSWSNPPGERALAIGLSEATLLGLLMGGLMTVVGWALTEAARLARENEAFV